MAKETLTKQEAAKDLYVALLITGNDKYGYFAVRADKVEEFQKLTSTDGEYKLPEYAMLLAEGNGTPSQEVKQRIEEKFGFSHDFLTDLKKQAAA